MHRGHARPSLHYSYWSTGDDTLGCVSSCSHNALNMQFHDSVSVFWFISLQRIFCLSWNWNVKDDTLKLVLIVCTDKVWVIPKIFLEFLCIDGLFVSFHSQKMYLYTFDSKVNSYLESTRLLRKKMQQLNKHYECYLHGNSAFRIYL